MPLLCCSRVGYEEIYLPDAAETDARDGSQMDAQTGDDADDRDAGADAGPDAADQTDAGEDAGADAGEDAGEDAGYVDAGGNDAADAADAADAEDGGSDDAGDQDPDQCGTIESYVESHSVVSTEFVEVPGSEIVFTPSGTSENWLVLVSAALASNYSGAAQVEANYTINSVEKGIGGIRPNDPWMAGAWQHFALVTGTVEPQTVAVSLREGRDGYQATILRLRVIAFRLPATAEAHYVNSETIRTVDPAVWQSYQTLDVNPQTAGSYLILSSVSASENPGQNSVGIRLVDPQGGYWPQANPLLLDHLAHHSNNRYPWRSFFVARAQDLDGPGSYQIEAIGSDPGGSQIYYSRILALRIQSFGTFQTTEYWPQVSNTTTTPLSASSLAVQPNPSGCPLLAIQSMFVYTSSSDSTYYVSDFVVDTTPVASYSNSFSTGFCMPFGVFHLLPGNGSPQLYNQFNPSFDGMEALVRESVIHVFGR